MTEAQLIHTGLEHRGVRQQRKCSRKLWKLLSRRMRIAERELVAKWSREFEAILETGSAHD